MESHRNDLLDVAYTMASWPVRLGLHTVTHIGLAAMRMPATTARLMVNVGGYLVKTDADMLRDNVPFHDAACAVNELESSRAQNDPTLLRACLFRAAMAVDRSADHCSGLLEVRMDEVAAAVAVIKLEVEPVDD